MTINSQTRTAGPYIGTGLSVPYPFAFKVFQASDLLVVTTDSLLNPTTLTLSVDYTVVLNTDQNVSPGGVFFLAVALPTGSSVTAGSNVPLTQTASLTNAGGFFPQVIENALDRLTILMQQIGITGKQTLRIPEFTTLPALPSAASRAGNLLGFDSQGNPIAVVPGPSGTATTLALDLVSTNTPAKGAGQIGFAYGLGYSTGTVGRWLQDLATSAGSTLVGFLQAGTGAVLRTMQAKLRDSVSVKDWGAKGDGVADDTAAIVAAIAAAIASGRHLYFPPGVYCVTTFTFLRGLQSVAFDNAFFQGIATTATPCIVRVKTEGCTYTGTLRVNLNWNTNYQCGTWWYDDTQSSQFNKFYGMVHYYGVRGLVYGEVPGNTSTSQAQSENVIFGFSSRGVQNPFYGNHSNGFLFAPGGIFVCNNEEWNLAPVGTPAFDWSAGRAVENFLGILTHSGGEIQKSGNTGGFAADLAGYYASDVTIEAAAPCRLVGTNVKISGGFHSLTVASTALWNIASFVGNADLHLFDQAIARAAGVGATDHTTMFDFTAATGTLSRIHFRPRKVDEWGWGHTAANTPICKGAILNIQSAKWQITAADPTIYDIDNTRVNLLNSKNVDTYGYETTGWLGVMESGSITGPSVASSGPPGDLAKSIEFTAAGLGHCLSVDQTSAATIKSTALRCAPGETYTLDLWVAAAAGTSINVVARYFDASGVALTTSTAGFPNGFYQLADVGSFIGRVSTEFNHLLLPVSVPAGAAYVAYGVRCNAATARFAIVRPRNA